MGQRSQAPAELIEVLLVSRWWCLLLPGGAPLSAHVPPPRRQPFQLLPSGEVPERELPLHKHGSTFNRRPSRFLFLDRPDAKLQPEPAFFLPSRGLSPYVVRYQIA